MKIAFTSPNGKTLAGHAGKCPGFVVVDVEGGKVLASQHVKLAKNQVFSQFSGALSAQPDHPLRGIEKLVTQGCGEGLIQRLARDGIETVVTDADTPETFLAADTINRDYGHD